MTDEAAQWRDFMDAKPSVSWWLFAVAGISVSGVSLLTLMWQVRKQ